jgi:plasmid replication initiation protein
VRPLNAYSQINEHTDITVSYEQHKAGRVITGFTFSLKQKKQPKDVSPKAKPKPKTNKNTDENNIDALLKSNDWVSKHAKSGESWDDARSRLKNEAETGKFTLT